jgi:valyl-tRNA synthetase
MGLTMAVISGIRNIRGEMNIPPSLALNVTLHAAAESIRRTLASHQDLITNLARVDQFRIDSDGKKPKASATAIIDGATIFVSLEGVIDFAKEAERLQKELAKLQDELNPLVKKLNNEDFLKKAPPEVVEKVREKHGGLLEKQEKLMSTLNKIQALGA